MNILQNRIDSFKNNVVKWPYSNNSKYAKTESFAKAGFYFIRRPKAPDSVRCFLCDIELSHWKPNQSPFVRHGHESPHCAWKRLNFPDAYKRPLSNPNKAYDSPRSIVMRSARLSTFNCHNYWPPKKGATKYPTAAKVAGAGFFFSPTATLPSRVKCAYCGESITVYPNDTELLNKHQELSNGCAFFEKTHSTRNSVSSRSSSGKSSSSSMKGDESETGSSISKRPINKASSSSETGRPVSKRLKEQQKILEPVVIIKKKTSDTDAAVSSKAKSATPKADDSVWDFNQMLTPPKPPKPPKPKRGVMVTYGSSRPVRHHPLSTRKNPSDVNILPDFNSPLIIKPNGPYNVLPATKPTDNAKKTPQASTKPRVTRTRRLQKPESSGSSTAAIKETNPPTKRSVSTSSVSDSDTPPTKKADLKKPIDTKTTNTETTPSPKKAFRDKGKGRAVEYNLSPTLPIKKTISLSRSRNKLPEPFVYISAAEGSGTSHQSSIRLSPARAIREESFSNTAYDNQALYGSHIAHGTQDISPMDQDTQDVSPHITQDTTDVPYSPTVQDTENVSPSPTNQDTHDVSPSPTNQDTHDVSPPTNQDTHDVSPHIFQDTTDVSNWATNQDTQDVSPHHIDTENLVVYNSPIMQDTQDVSPYPINTENIVVYSSPIMQDTEDMYPLVNPPSPVYTHEATFIDHENVPSPEPIRYSPVREYSSIYNNIQSNQENILPPIREYSSVYNNQSNQEYSSVYNNNQSSQEDLLPPIREYSSVYNNQSNQEYSSVYNNQSNQEYSSVYNSNQSSQEDLLPPIREYSSVYNNNQSPVNLPQDSSMHIANYSPEPSSSLAFAPSPPRWPASSAITGMSFLQSTPSDTQRRLASATDVFGTNPLSPIRPSHATSFGDLQYTPALTECRFKQIITQDDEGRAHSPQIKQEPTESGLLSDYLLQNQNMTLEENWNSLVKASVERLREKCEADIKKVESMYKVSLNQLEKDL